MRWILLVVVASCGGPAPQRPVATPARVPTGAEHCEMAAAALRETVKSNAAQPYGLEDACVQRLASAEGVTYVDARFNDVAKQGGSIEPCSRDQYRIRFNVGGFSPSPAQGVVLLMVGPEKDGGRDFTAIVEEPNWPARRSEVLAVSPCGSAVGSLRRSPSGWTATVVPPPRSPDAL